MTKRGAKKATKPATKKKPAKKATKKKTAKKASKKAGRKKGETSTLAERRAKIRARSGVPTVIFEDDADKTPVYKTRFPRINRYLNGGLRGGCIVEMFGFEDSGKSTTAVAFAADVQSQAPEGKNHVVLVNYEGPEPWDWWRKIGLNTDPDHFTQLRPQSLEEGMADLYDLIESGEVCCAIVDSVYAAAAKTRADMMKKWAGESSKGAALGVEAVRWGEAWTSLKNHFQTHNVVVLAVNQMREKIETGGAPRKGYSKPVTTPRGHALKFYAWVRIRMEGRVLLDSEGGLRKDVDGKCVRMKIVKNKTSDEARAKVDYDLIRGFGFDLIGDLIQCALDAGAIKHKGGGNYECGKHKVRGKAKLRAWVEGSERVQAILTQYVERWMSKKTLGELTIEKPDMEPDDEDDDSEDE